MVAIAPLLPTNTPPPMIPPMEIITRCRASSDLESFEDADPGVETSVAFNVFALVVGRKIGGTIRRNIRKLQLARKRRRNLEAPAPESDSTGNQLPLELVSRSQVERAADLGLEQRVLALAVDVQRVALVREVLRFQDQREVIGYVPRRRSVDERVGLVRADIAARRGWQSANVLVAVRTGEADLEGAVIVEQRAARRVWREIHQIVLGERQRHASGAREHVLDR